MSDLSTAEFLVLAFWFVMCLCGLPALLIRIAHLKAERDRLREALRTVLGILDDPTSGTHVQDMRRTQEVARAALTAKELRDE